MNNEHVSFNRSILGEWVIKILKYYLIVDHLCKLTTKSLKLIINNIGPNYSHRSNIPFQGNQEIISSTPITEKIPSLMINPLLSPINIPIDDEYSILWTESFFKRNISNIQNSNESKQISKTLRTLSINNNIDSHQTSENIDIAKMEYSNNTQDQMYFISRDPKYVPAENESLQTDMNNLSFIRNKDYRKDKTKVNDNNITSEYFNNIKKEKRRKRKCTKQNLSEKLQSNYKKSSKYLKNNLSQKSNKSPSINIKMRKVIKIEHNTKKSYFESRANESWTRIKQAFSNQSFSDLDKTTQTPITKKSSLWVNKHCNTIEKDSIKLNYNNTQENNLDNYSMNVESVESQNYNSWENSKFSENSSLEVSYSVQTSNVNESNKYNTSNTSQTNSQVFSEDSFSSLNLTNSSQQLDSIQQDFMKSSVDSSDDNNYENYENHNEVPKLFNNIQFVETPYSISDDNIALVNELNP